MKTELTPKTILEYMPEIYRLLRHDFDVDRVIKAELKDGVLTMNTDSDKGKFQRRSIVIGLAGLRAGE